MKNQYLCLLAVIMTFCGCRRDSVSEPLGDGSCRVSFRGGEQLEVSYGSPTKGSSLLTKGVTARALAYQRIQGGSAPDPSKDTWYAANSYAVQADGALHASLVDDKGEIVEGETKEMELSNGVYDFYGYSPALKIEGDNRTVKGIPHYMDFLGTVTPAKAVSRSASEVALVFAHLCSKVRFNVRTTSDMSNASVSAQKVTLNKMAVSPADYTLGGTLAPTVGTVENVCTLDKVESASDGKSSSVWQVLLPKGDGTFEGSFYVTVEGKQYVLKAKDIPTMSFLKGTQYIFTATVMQGTVVLNLSVASWKAVSGTVDGGAGSGAGSGSWEGGGGDPGGAAGGNNSLEIGRWEDIDWSGSLGGNPDPVTGAVEVGSWKKADVLVDAGGTHVAGVDQWVTKQLEALAGENNDGNLADWNNNNSESSMGGGAMQIIKANCGILAKADEVIAFDVEDRVTRAKTAPGNSAMTLSWTKGEEYIPLVIWQDRPFGLLASMDYDKTAGLLTVTKDKNERAKGNVVVGLFPKGTSDPSGGDCIWSWHVWVTDYNPDGKASYGLAVNSVAEVPGGQVQTYGTKYMTKNPGKAIMDRNLGATEGYTERPGLVDNACFGLFYQWGRKDPFPQWDGEGSSDNEAKTIKIYGANGSPELPEDRTGLQKIHIALAGNAGPNLPYATKNPLTFVYNTDTPFDWYTSVAANQNNTLWGDGGPKSVYDPCPQGWRVPPGGTWEDFGNDPYAEPFFYYVNGVRLSGPDAVTFEASGRNGRHYDAGLIEVTETWYPAAGFRDAGDNGKNGALMTVGNGGYSWASTVNGVNGFRLGFSPSWLSPPNSANDRANGFSVRCIQE